MVALAFFFHVASTLDPMGKVSNRYSFNLVWSHFKLFLNFCPSGPHSSVLKIYEVKLWCGLMGCCSQYAQMIFEFRKKIVRNFLLFINIGRGGGESSFFFLILQANSCYRLLVVHGPHKMFFLEILNSLWTKQSVVVQRDGTSRLDKNSHCSTLGMLVWAILTKKKKTAITRQEMATLENN